MIRVQAEPFDPGAEIAAFTDTSGRVGAVATFLGLVRDHHPQGAPPQPSSLARLEPGDRLPVRAMTLEHYPGMTERQLEALEQEARDRWPLGDVLVIHRHGRLEPGAPIVLVCTASAHRAAALDSCAFLIDRLKTKAPFWKREETPEGERWVEARAGDDMAAARWTSSNSESE